MGWAQPIFFSGTNTTVRLGELLETTIPPMGYELVDWEMQPRAGLSAFSSTSRGNEGVGCVEDCARVSNHLTHLFTVENIDYDRLEVRRRAWTGR